MAFVLANGLNDMIHEDAPAPASERVAVPPAGDIGNNGSRCINGDDRASDAPAAPASESVGCLSVSFAEQLPGDRERWAIRDGKGRLVGAAFGREAALMRARVLNEGIE